MYVCAYIYIYIDTHIYIYDCLRVFSDIGGGPRDRGTSRPNSKQFTPAK